MRDEEDVRCRGNSRGIISCRGSAMTLPDLGYLR